MLLISFLGWDKSISGFPELTVWEGDLNDVNVINQIHGQEAEDIYKKLIGESK